MYQFFSSDLFGLAADTANLIANGVVALIVVLLAVLLYKMFTRPRMASGRRSKNARLAITDAASIDDRRRIVLVRRDDVEHLIMIGGATDMVIEADIQPATAAARPATSVSVATGPSHVAPTAPADQPVPVTPTAAKAPAPTPAAKSPPPLAAVPTPATAPAASAPTSNGNFGTGLGSEKPARPASPVLATAKPANIPSIPAAGSSNGVQPAAKNPSLNDASSLIGDVRAKPVQPAPTKKATVGDNMDALLSEITAKK